MTLRKMRDIMNILNKLRKDYQWILECWSFFAGLKECDLSTLEDNELYVYSVLNTRPRNSLVFKDVRMDKRKGISSMCIATEMVHHCQSGNFQFSTFLSGTRPSFHDTEWCNDYFIKVIISVQGIGDGWFKYVHNNGTYCWVDWAAIGPDLWKQYGEYTVSQIIPLWRWWLFRPSTHFID